MAINLQSLKLVPMIFDVQCGKCSFTGTVSYDGPNIKTLNVGGQVNFEGAKCPSCGAEEIHAPGGTYERNPETGRMNRTGDFQKPETKSI